MKMKLTDMKAYMRHEYKSASHRCWRE